MYEYDDYLNDQRENLNELLENDFPFLKEINTLVEDEVLKRINSTVEGYENKLIKYEEAINNQDSYKKEIRGLKRDLEEQEKQFQTKLQKESRRNVFGVDCGDEIWHVKSIGKRVPCNTCNATGKLKAVVDGQQDEIEVDCPNCRGHKEKYESEDKVVNGFVAQITYKTWNDGNTSNMELYIYPRRNRSGDSYTVDTEYRKVFKTEVEAISYLEELKNKQK